VILVQLVVLEATQILLGMISRAGGTSFTLLAVPVLSIVYSTRPSRIDDHSSEHTSPHRMPNKYICTSHARSACAAVVSRRG